MKHHRRYNTGLPKIFTVSCILFAAAESGFAWSAESVAKQSRMWQQTDVDGAQTSAGEGARCIFLEKADLTDGQSSQDDISPPLPEIQVNLDHPRPGTYMPAVNFLLGGPRKALNFVYPVGPPDGAGYVITQDFGVYKNESYPYHLGEDWSGIEGGNTDCGDPVYSIANGEIVYANDNHDVNGDWENVLILRHTLPDGSQIESMYVHLRTILHAKGASVSMSEPIGTIGDGNGAFMCHLHLEIRTQTGLPVGNGYSEIPAPDGWTDPSDFIDAY